MWLVNELCGAPFLGLAQTKESLALYGRGIACVIEGGLVCPTILRPRQPPRATAY